MVRESARLVRTNKENPHTNHVITCYLLLTINLHPFNMQIYAE